jgi:hypothetical protein
MAADALADRIAAHSVEIVRRGKLALPLRPEKEPLLVLFPDLAEVSELFTFEGGPRHPEEVVKSLLAGWGPARLFRVPVVKEGAAALAPALSKASRILFFCFEARRFPGQRKTLELLARRAPDRAAVCLIRNPWDLELLPKSVSAVDTKGYRLCQLRAGLAAILQGEGADR